MTDEIELSGKIFRSDGAPEVINSDASNPLDLSDLLEQIEAGGTGGSLPPPSLVNEQPIQWMQHSGLHSSLLSTSTRSDTAESWQSLVEEYVEESKHTKDEALRGALLCEAGRILIDRLGRQDEGDLLLRRSESPIAGVLQSNSGTTVASLAAELTALESVARDEHSDSSTRAAAWVEFGQLCEERTPSIARAFEAYREALDLVPEHPVALPLAADAALIVEDPRAHQLIEARINQAQAPRVRVAALLDLADITSDPTQRRNILEHAHRTEPNEETALRRLIRATAGSDDPAHLGALYRELARIARDPVSRSTALHLGFLTLAEAGQPLDDLVLELSEAEGPGSDRADVLAPLSEVALHVEQRIATGEESEGLPDNIPILDRLWSCLDDPREQALVREQLARLRLDVVRKIRTEETTPEDSLTGMAKLPEDTAQLAESLEADLRFCLAHMPEHRWISEALAELLEFRRDLPGLVLHLQEWSRKQSAGPGRAEILLRLGEVHEGMRDDLPRAAEVYELAVAEDPDNPNCLRALGRAYEKMRRWPQAIASLQRQATEADDPTDRLTALRRVASMAEHEINDVDLAIATLEEIARADPDDLLSLYQLAALCRTHGRPSVLIAALQTLVERVDDDVARTTILVELGEVQELHLKQRAAAQECYERALNLSPGYAPALRALARLYRDNGDLEALLGLLTPERDPVTDPAVLALKAARVALDEIGDVERAIDLYRSAYESNPDLIPAREALVGVLTANGRIQEAYDLLRGQDLPTSPALQADYHYRLGLLTEALARAADHPEATLAHQDAALQHHRSALLAQPNHGLATERSRRLLVAQHDTPNFIRLLEEQLAHAPDDLRPVLLTQIARLQLSRTDGREAARNAYEQCYQIAAADPLVRREFEVVLRQVDARESLPALYLSAARQSTDTHYKATLLVEAAELLLDGGAAEDRDVAANAILDALRADPGNPYAVRHLERLLGSPNINLAVKDAVGARAVRAQSDAERAIFYLESAELLELSGNLEQARRAYIAAQDALPGLTPAQMGIDRIATGQQRVSRVQEVKTSIHVLMAEARDASVRSGTGDAEATDLALTRIGEILERDPHYRDAIALARALAGQLPDASRVVELLGRVFPRVEDTGLRYELGLFLGDHVQALEDSVTYYGAAASSRPDGKQALRGLVGAYRRLGDDRRAAEATERLLQLFAPEEPSAIDLRLGIASFLGSSPETLQRAIEHTRVVLQARSDDPRAVMLMADLLERDGQREEAAGLLDRLVDRERSREKQHEITLRKALLLSQVPGREHAALEAVERAAALNPGHRETITLLVDLFARTGQSDRIGTHIQSIRAALLANINRGAVSLRDLRLLSRVADTGNPALARMAHLILHAIEPSSTEPPPGHMVEASRAGLQRILQTASLRAALHSIGEPAELDQLLQAVDPAMARLSTEFPAFDADDATPVPPSADPASFSMVMNKWIATMSLPPFDLGACGSHNAAVLLAGRGATLRLGSNLWMQGDSAGWRGLVAVALARHALGATRARALSPMELDLLIAGCFELVEVFNPITADPDPRRLRDLTTQLGKLLTRRSRRLVERLCQALSSHAFAPSEAARATTGTDLRLAVVLTGDPSGVLSAACLLDGVAGGGLKQRINRSRLAQSLMGFMLSDVFSTLRAAALEE